MFTRIILNEAIAIISPARSAPANYLTLHYGAQKSNKARKLQAQVMMKLQHHHIELIRNRSDQLSQFLLLYIFPFFLNFSTV